MVKKLIINADDFGLSDHTVEWTINGFECGALTSATIMAGMPTTDKAVGYAKVHPQFSFGVHFYLVDETTGHYVCLHCNIEFVETVIEIEDVGEEDVAVALTPDNLNADGLYNITVDMTKACEALGIDISEIESVTWLTLNTSGGFSAVESFEGEDCMFDSNGINVTADSEDAKFAIGYDYESNIFVASLLGDDPTAETIYSTRIALRNGAKRYIFNVTIGYEEALSIDNVKT
jgi:hypothetical protein